METYCTKSRQHSIWRHLPKATSAETHTSPRKAAIGLIANQRIPNRRIRRTVHQPRNESTGQNHKPDNSQQAADNAEDRYANRAVDLSEFKCHSMQPQMQYATPLAAMNAQSASIAKHTTRNLNCLKTTAPVNSPK